MTLLSFWLLVVLTAQICTAKEGIFIENDVLMMRELSIRTSKDEQKLDHPHDQEVFMSYVNIPMLNASMLSRLKNATKIKVKHGVLSIIEIPEHLVKIDLESCHTDDVLIDSGKRDFKLKELYVHHNELRSVPGNLSYLKSLVELVLNDNEIETVEMSSFQGLDNLRVVALQRNAIASITTWQHKLIHLPSLINLYLDQNHLAEISFTSLLAESLNTVHLHENNLTMALGLTSAFPALATVRIHGNPLDCTWTKYVLEDLRGRNVTIADLREATCRNGTVTQKIAPDERPNLMAIIAGGRHPYQKSSEEFRWIGK